MKIVFRGKDKKGKEIVIRYPQKSDIREMHRYVNELSSERTFVSLQGEDVTLEEEEKFLTETLEKIENKKAVMLLVFEGEKLVGICQIQLNKRATSHVAGFGISLAKDYRGEGLGTILMKKTLEEAEKELPDLKIITISLMSNNDIAKKLYKKLGFVEFGALPGGIRHRDKLVDHVYLYKRVKN